MAYERRNLYQNSYAMRENGSSRGYGVRTPYSYGTAARDYESNVISLPEIGREQEERYEQEERAKKARAIRKHERAMAHSLDFISMLALIVASVVTMITLVSFLSAQSDVTRLSKQVASLETEVIRMKNDNTAALDAINSNVDMTKIYETATKELGMHVPTASQIVTYSSTASDYVKQYEKVPEVASASTAQSFFGKLKSWWTSR